MKIVIAGAGFTGTQLAHHLVQEKHDVSLIESNEETARHASNRLDCLVLHNMGNSLEALEEAGIGKADALVCVTESDEVNMIICGLAASFNREENNKKKAKKLFKVARVRNTDYKMLNRKNDADENEKSGLSDQKILGIDCFIHPDIEAARAVLTSLTHGASGNILTFPGTPYELASVNIQEGSVFDGLSLMDFHSFIREEGLITLVERGQSCFLPTGSTKLCPKDLIYIITRKEDMAQVFRLAGITETPLRRIGIVGGGRVGSFIAEGLLNPQEKTGGKSKKDGNPFLKFFIPKSSRQVIIIEQNYLVCKEIAGRFPEALILNEDITNENFIAEEKINDLDLIITCTDNQELNIVAAVYLKSRGVRRTIALVSGPGYKTIALQLGVDVAIPVKSVVVDSILSHLAGRSIRGIHSLGDGSVGIVEAEIEEDSHAVEKSIKDFKLSQGGLIMLVNREETSFIPQGDYVFKAGDKIIIIAKNGSEAELEKFFGKTKQ
jgi:trk system potassium uptake protein TrkA